MRLTRRCLLLCLVAWLPVRVLADSEPGFEIRRAELVAVDGTYVLNADVDFRFSQTAIEALEHGVPLTLVARFKIKRHRDYWLDETVFSESRRILIRYHPLTKFFQLFSDSAGVPRSFAGLPALLDTMGEIRGWRSLPVSSLEPDGAYTAQFSVKLDIEALPLPLRPLAYVSPSWYLGSPPFQWPVAAN